MTTPQPPQPPEPQEPPEPQKSMAAPKIRLSRKQPGSFPDLYGTAAKYARQNQRWYFRLLRWELIAVVVAALAQFLLRPFGQQIASLVHFRLGDISLHVLDFSYTFSSANVTSALAGSFVPVLAVLAVIGLTLSRYFFKLDEKWRMRRSLAEGVLGLVWRYGMNALPNDLPGSDPAGPHGDAEYAIAYQVLANTAANMDLPPADTSTKTITDPMAELRNEDWTSKRATYLKDRLEEQTAYYLGQAKDYRKTRDRLQRAMIGCYLLGGLLLPFNGLGVFTTAAGALGSWLGGKHYSDLAQSYSAMQRDLEIYHTRADALSAQDPLGAAKWSQLVNEIETRLDGEHQAWLQRIGQ